MFCLIKRGLGAVFEFIEIWYKFKMHRKDFRNILHKWKNMLYCIVSVMEWTDQ